MKNYLINLVITIILIASSEASNRLWYDKAAEGWTWALPVGNGRMGAMIYGAVDGNTFNIMSTRYGEANHTITQELTPFNH